MRIKEPIICEKCGSKYVVNKKYKLCARHNFERTHEGKTQQQVYSERSQGKDKKKKSKSLSSVSTKNRYRCSDGTLVSQVEINRNLRQVYKFIDSSRERCCQGCNNYTKPLSHSHIISVARCKELGKAELIYDEDNLEIECFGAPSSNPTECHNIWESGDLEIKKSLLNFNRKLQYIKINDPETYRKIYE